MAEGGKHSWKVQRLVLAPTLSYDNIQRPLQAPKGKTWFFDPSLKKWALADVIVDHSTTVEYENSSDVTPHYITPSDTFQGICLKYKIKPLELRRANGGFTGTNLNLAPNPLVIPSQYSMQIGEDTVACEAIPLTQSEVVGLLLKECNTGMSRSEARSYLLLADWDLAEALENAHHDGF